MGKPGEKLTKGEATTITSIVVIPAMFGFYLMVKCFKLLYLAYKWIFVGIYKLVKLAVKKFKEKE